MALCPEAGVIPIYLPPYPLQMNPIEKFFAQLERFIKGNWRVQEQGKQTDLTPFSRWCRDRSLITLNAQKEARDTSLAFLHTHAYPHVNSERMSPAGAAAYDRGNRRLVLTDPEMIHYGLTLLHVRLNVQN